VVAEPEAFDPERDNARPNISFRSPQVLWVAQ
jgi:hypothetical protein